MKWLKSAFYHLIVLTNDNLLRIFDVNADFSVPESEIFLQNTEKIVDFTCNSTKFMFDLSLFAVFLVDFQGNVFCLGPLFLNNSRISCKKLQFFEERVTSDIDLKTEEKLELLQFFNKNTVSFAGTCAFPGKKAKNLRVFQVFSAKNYEKPQRKAEICEIFKIKNTIYHVLAVVAIDGTVKILGSTRNLWFFQEKVAFFNKN